MKTTFLPRAWLTTMAALSALGQTTTNPPRETVALIPSYLIGSVPSGTDFTVSLFANDVQNAGLLPYGFQFDLKFDAAKLQAIDVTEESAFKSTNLSDFTPGAIDNTAGLIHTTYDTLQGPSARVPGPVVPLAIVKFHALQPGDAVVSLLYPVLVDRTGARILLNVVPSASILISDSTPPTVTPQISGTLGSNGWYTSNVIVSWTAADAKSTITSQPCPATTITADTTGQTVTCKQTNAAGLSTTSSVIIKRDATVPTVKPVLTGTLGTNGWYTSNVTLNWTATGAISGVPAAPCAAATVSADTAGTVFNCQATSGAGLFNTASVTVKRDASVPVITPVITGTLGGGWYTSDVSVTWKYTLGPSQSAGALCPATSLTTDTPRFTASCSITSGAGLTGSQSVTLKRDATPPVISGLPAPGTCSLWPPNQKIVTVATVVAKDGGSNGSGLVPGSFLVTGVSNEPQSAENPDIIIQGGVVQVRADRLGTGTGRVYTFTAVASDVAGNKSTATGQCTVPHSQGQ